MNPLIESIFATRTVRDAEGNAIDCSTSAILPETGQLLYDFLTKDKPTRTLETGLGFGLSALCISQALAENGGGLHTAIDPNQKGARCKSIGLLNMEPAGFKDAFRFFHAPSSQTLPQLLHAGERFDFAFIDGPHLFDDVILDFCYLDKLIEIGRCVAFDDLWMPGVTRAINFVLRNHAYELVTISSSTAPEGWRHPARSARRFFQNPSSRDAKLRAIPYNLCFLRKMADDHQPWNDYHPF